MVLVNNALLAIQEENDRANFFAIMENMVRGQNKTKLVLIDD